MLLFTFQASILALIVLSFILVITVPVILVQQMDGKITNPLFYQVLAFGLAFNIFLIGILNNFVV
uniref:Photosystem II reaction center protein Z n=1 Tax=Euglena hiemalis TaxID=392896 RepID=A0A345UC69_9EUGL|nr:photosystem II protein Z [Euglena hiemalis]AXI98055.1 photosystem II protein Z [Euglena hiemalis]